MPITIPGDGTVQVNAAFLGSSAGSDAGSIGTVTFTVSSGFITSTSVVLASGEYGTAAGTTKLDIGSGGATVIFGGGDTAEPNPDFNGDGSVNFQDFLQFAGAFGSKSSDANWDPIFDLNQDGEVNFPDFLQFAGAFTGKRALAKPLGSFGMGVNSQSEVQMIVGSGEKAEEVAVEVRLSHAVDVQGYGMRVLYDLSTLEFLGAIAQTKSIFETESTVALQAIPNDGEILLSDMMDPQSALEGDSGLVTLRFRLLDEAISGHVEIAELLVSDGLGRVDQLVGKHLAELRAMPDSFALSGNFPNPFNPETQIVYQIPVAGEVNLVIYNLLGQEVRSLVQRTQQAGFYRVTWDGKDSLGRSVSSGVYPMRMNSGEFSGVQKMLLLK